MPRRIGVVGYGRLGQHIVSDIQQDPELQLAFVWNRSKDAMEGKVDESLVLDNLENFKERQADLIVEVAHPSISEQYGHKFLETSDYMVGSPTALAEPQVERSLRAACTRHGLYIPQGAFWGGEDIRKMADRNTLQALKITMSKHPESLKLHGTLEELKKSATDQKVVLYDGSVRDLCPLAPNNVNTMAAGAIMAHTLGFDKVQGRLVADPSLTEHHVVEVQVWGPGGFQCHTVRRSPARVGDVTSTATFVSFLSSLRGAQGKGPGVHLC